MRARGLEPPRGKAPPGPKPGASPSFATPARIQDRAGRERVVHDRSNRPRAGVAGERRGQVPRGPRGRARGAGPAGGGGGEEEREERDRQGDERQSGTDEPE